jgi:predicted ABC-type ATPase
VNDGIPRLRMFAGPNGSGKTTIKIGLARPREWFGIYINPDELESSIRSSSIFALEPFEISARADEIQAHFASSRLLLSHRLTEAASVIECRDGAIDFHGLEMNSYYASVLADFLRRKALEASKTFTFETVMSSPDKVELLKAAQSRGYRTYLYYVATEDPAINVMRVKNRVAEGGHDVPTEKIVSRYHRSLALAREAIAHSHRAFFFDTSEEDSWYFAEITNGDKIEFKSKEIPNWFRSIWDPM